jgi:hypothetical protein
MDCRVATLLAMTISVSFAITPINVPFIRKIAITDNRRRDCESSMKLQRRFRLPLDGRILKSLAVARAKRDICAICDMFAGVGP